MNDALEKEIKKTLNDTITSLKSGQMVGKRIN